MIDNVPPVEGSAEHTSLVSTLRDALQLDRAAEARFGTGKKGWIGQDRFHVMHNLTPHTNTNNTDPRFFPLMILDVRNRVTVRDEIKMAALDQKLKDGLVAKKVTFGSAVFEVKLGQHMTQPQIDAWKVNGVYHEMFSTRSAIVPEYVKDESTIHSELDAWAADVRRECFAADGSPIKHARTGTVLMDSLAVLEDILTSAKRRFAKCIPPDHLRHLAYWDTGEVQNGMAVMRSCFHTCGNESWHSTLPDFVVGDHSSVQRATALYYEGIVRQNARNQRAVGLEEDSGHHDLETVLAVNKWAGHGQEAQAASATQLVETPPHRLLERPVATGETYLQDVGAFDAVARRARRVVQSGGAVAIRGPMPSLGAAPSSFTRLFSQRESKPRPAPSNATPPSSRRKRQISDDDSDDEAPHPPLMPQSQPQPQLVAPPQPVAPPLQLAQASTGTGTGKGKGKAKLAGREDESKNKWLCTERHPEQPQPQGRTRHPDPRCPRGCWATDARVSFAPQKGEIVTILEASQAGVAPAVGSAAGKKYKYLGSKSWVCAD
jgi:hypothetical protein